MPLGIGTRLGSYEILGAIGAGGMGEVYRGRDTQLKREVAIKVLPHGLSTDIDRLTRFQREAELLASLNHPNIAQIYGLTDEHGVRGLVMELVEGPTLADRIACGAMPLDEVLPIAQQLVQAIDYAHEHAIVHRDLKPANIKMTPEAAVKVLDFGLAKAIVDEPIGIDAANSPTMASPAMTRAGIILGTAAYMSPEQARAAATDKRADIWAFGCVLYEMLTGRPAFRGDTATDVLAAVVTKPPDWAALPAGTPARLRRLLERCLEKDARRRLRDIADARLDLEEAAIRSDADVTTITAARRPGIRSAILAIAAAAAIGGAFFIGTQWGTTEVAALREWRGERLGGSAIAFDPQISPDGQTLAFQAMVDTLNQVAVMKPGAPGWQVLTSDRARGVVTDISWSSDGTRVFFTRYGAMAWGIFSVPLYGGGERRILENALAPRALADGSLLITRRNADRRWQLHRFWPDSERLDALGALLSENRLLDPAVETFPDGTEAVYYGRPADRPQDGDHLYVIDLASGRSRRVAPRIDIPPDIWRFPLAVMPGDGRILFDLPDGDLHRIVAVPRDGSDRIDTLLSLTAMPQFLSASSDGSIYVDQTMAPGELLTFSPDQSRIDRKLLPIGGASSAPLHDGRLLVSEVTPGRNRVMVLAPAGSPAPFIETQEETAGPLSTLGDDRVALLVGSAPNRSLAIASVDGRIVRRLTGVDADAIVALAGTPDGRRIFYVAGGTVWTVPSEGGTPVEVHKGDRVAVDPLGRYLVIMLTELPVTRLVRVPIDGGPAVTIPVAGTINLFPNGLTANAIGRDGRLVVRVSLNDAWHAPVAILDPRTGHVEPIKAGVDLDMYEGGWTPDGRVMTFANPTFSSLWRFRRQ